MERSKTKSPAQSQRINIHQIREVYILSFAICVLLMMNPVSIQAQDADVVLDPEWAQDPPELSTLVNFAREESDFRVAVVRYLEDRAAIGRRYPVYYSPVRQERYRDFFTGWQESLEEVDFDALNHEGQIDYILLKNRVTYDLEMLNLDGERWIQISDLVPFSEDLRLLQETRYNRERVVPRESAQTMDDAAILLEELTYELKNSEASDYPDVSPAIASRAANYVAHLRETVSDWNDFYEGYDPMYNFWNRVPYERLQTALQDYENALIENLVGITPGDPGPIIGDPVMAEGLEADLALHMIPYTAEELIAIGEREFEWIVDRFEEVSNDMGFGDDWKAALEHVKGLAPPPGEKPWAIFDIADYSEEYVHNMDNITIPPLAEEVWRLDMQTPERQLINPFFSGGEVTRVSYPTDDMTHQNKLMSMRGNTPPFNFATVHHELIPGHHLQGFMSDRFNVHRGDLNRTPFWGEGWALYWELILWDDGFPRDNPDKIGMLFWRLHRAARIVFSLNFQLGNWSAQEAVDFLVDEVGHERANAEAEVRRSARAMPLYQIAYMIGGMQFRALREEVVDSGDMTLTEFHDAVLQGGRMPIEMVRARLTKHELNADYESQWRWEGDSLAD
ncbi:DUF885 family protein [Rhodohalobacter sp. 614A]|uniref:DUF885 family protein n=1 Tax=Rhodohalobacter sp. 614A TaxID=2908649 RepID=UPI001F39099D|nr:DUF885 family protein [Rhodohalobacter sp. 614A]